VRCSHLTAVLPVCIGILLRSTPLPAQTGPLPCELHLSGTFPEQFKLADIDADGWDELIKFGDWDSDERVSAAFIMYEIEAGGEWTLDQVNIKDGRIGDLMVADLDHDGRPEILTSIQLERGARAEVWDPETNERRRMTAVIPTPDHDGSGRWVGSARLGAPLAYDEDDVDDIVLELSAGFDLAPRGYRVLSGRTGELLATFETPGWTGETIAVPGMDGVDIHYVVESAAIGNGRKIGDFDDSHSYLFALDETFEPRWHRLVCGFPAVRMLPHLLDVDDDGIPEVLLQCELRPPRSDTRLYQLQAVDLRTGQLKRWFDLRAQANGLCIGDLDRDTADEIVLGDREGHVVILDHRLDPLLEHQFSGSVGDVWMGDLDHDGEIEVAACHNVNELTVMDASLNTLAERRIGSALRQIRSARVGPKRTLLYLNTSRNDPKYKVEMSQASGAPLSGGLPVSTLLFYTGCGLVLGAAAASWLFVARGRRLAGTSRRRERAERHVREELLTELTAFGHSGMARRNLERLAQFSEAAQARNDPRADLYNERLESRRQTYRGYTREMLARIIALAERVPGPGDAIEPLRRAHRKLEQLLGEQEQGAGPVEVGRTLASLSTDDLGRIAANARGLVGAVVELRRAVLRSYRTNVPGVAGQVLAMLHEHLTASGVEHVRLDLAGCDPVAVDEACLKTCLEILLNNAAEAMQGRPERRLSIRVSQQNMNVLIRVEDTGAGIAEEDRENVFERDYTTKGEGHGLGLFHARQSVARYRGKIWIEDGAGGAGACFAVSFPTIDPGVGDDAS
jgi:signal transduction histidine kinase